MVSAKLPADLRSVEFARDRRPLGKEKVPGSNPGVGSTTSPASRPASVWKSGNQLFSKADLPHTRGSLRRQTSRAASPAALRADQWKTKPASTTSTWPVVVSERQKVTTWSATSSADVPL